MIKLISKKFTFIESEKRYDIFLNNKKIVAFKYEKQDPQNNDYDTEIKIQNEEDLTEEEIEEVENFINDNL